MSEKLRFYAAYRDLPYTFVEDKWIPNGKVGYIASDGVTGEASLKYLNRLTGTKLVIGLGLLADPSGTGKINSFEDAMLGLGRLRIGYNDVNLIISRVPKIAVGPLYYSIDGTAGFGIYSFSSSPLSQIEYMLPILAPILLLNSAQRFDDPEKIITDSAGALLNILIPVSSIKELYNFLFPKAASSDISVNSSLELSDLLTSIRNLKDTNSLYTAINILGDILNKGEIIDPFMKASLRTLRDDAVFQTKGAATLLGIKEEPTETLEREIKATTARLKAFRQKGADEITDGDINAYLEDMLYVAGKSKLDVKGEVVDWKIKYTITNNHDLYLEDPEDMVALLEEIAYGYKNVFSEGKPVFELLKSSTAAMAKDLNASVLALNDGTAKIKPVLEKRLMLENRLSLISSLALTREHIETRGSYIFQKISELEEPKRAKLLDRLALVTKKAIGREMGPNEMAKGIMLLVNDDNIRQYKVLSPIYDALEYCKKLSERYDRGVGPGTDLISNSFSVAHLVNSITLEDGYYELYKATSSAFKIVERDGSMSEIEDMEELGAQNYVMLKRMKQLLEIASSKRSGEISMFRQDFALKQNSDKKLMNWAFDDIDSVFEASNPFSYDMEELVEEFRAMFEGRDDLLAVVDALEERSSLLRTRFGELRDIMNELNVATYHRKMSRAIRESAKLEQRSSKKMEEISELLSEGSGIFRDIQTIVALTNGLDDEHKERIGELLNALSENVTNVLDHQKKACGFFQEIMKRRSILTTLDL